MKRAWSVAAGLLLLVASAPAQDSKYNAAGIAQAGDIAYPLNAQAPGVVTLDVSLDASAAVQNVTIVRDLPPFTAVAQNAVQGWQFTPAIVEGQGVAGAVRVHVVFNPYNPGGVGLPGLSLQPAAGGAAGSFQPAGLQKANYASYPPNTVASGTVVLQVHVGRDGKVHGVLVARGKGALIGAATSAAKSWVFSPATYRGGAVASDVVVVFVFPLPQAGTR